MKVKVLFALTAAELTVDINAYLAMLVSEYVIDIKFAMCDQGYSALIMIQGVK